MRQWLIVCTGNTCRSPMMAALLRAGLAHANITDVTVSSAGTAAANGAPASTGAYRAVHALGLELHDHRSHSLPTDLTAYERIWCMTSRHAAAVRARGVEPERLAVIAAEDGGVPDPFGGDAAEYAACAAVLAAAAQHIVQAETAARSTALPHNPAMTNPQAAISTAVAAALAAIDAAHAADPTQRDGEPAELQYARAMTEWLLRLRPDADSALILAARAQHLERWLLPRSAYPLTKSGYYAWRIEQYRRQGARAHALCVANGIAADVAQRVEQLVAKTLAKEADGQTLEDAACLVFLDQEVAGFAADHPDYSAEKYVDILRKTARKMSAQGRAQAVALPLPEPFAGLLHQALAG